MHQLVGSHKDHNNHRSSERKFDLFVIQIDGRPKNARKLFCSTPGCGQQGELLDHSQSGMAPAFVERKFRQKGWEVGKKPSEDLCPSCVLTRQAERRAKRVKPLPAAIVQAVAHHPEKPIMSLNGTKADTPELRPADRRIIFAQLEEVYADETTGYRDGWSDSAVAKHLGSHIPVAWVAEVREQNFGPVKDNGEIREMLDRVETATKEAIGVLDQAKLIRSDGSALVGRINDLVKQCADIAKKLDGLQATADRIRQYIA